MTTSSETTGSRTPEPLAAGLGFDLSGHRGALFENLPVPRLYEEAIKRDEAMLSEGGPLLAVTGTHTGRSPKDRFLVRHPGSDDLWWGTVNRPISPAAFDDLLERAQAYARARDLFVFEGHAGAHPSHQLGVRVITEYAWHSLFAHNMFISNGLMAAESGARAGAHDFRAQFTVVDLPGLVADPALHGTRSKTFIVLDLERRMALIGGTQYAGEIKKCVFAVMNHALPKAGVLSMHCSANYGQSHDDGALFFGLSGTGKTTLSADPSRTLIGDDEHGWGDDGVFNLEGGCYAKVIRLNAASEPEIFATTQTFGTVLENVVCDPNSRKLDLDDESLTENTRSSYPLTQLDKVDLGGMAGHPKNVIFLTCDAFGVLPPIARLSRAQAMYHFLSGYTAKVAGTERGVTEPEATFSACFGAPFLPLPPAVYARMLGQKLVEHGSSVWLVNTGWTGGAHGEGRRMSLVDTRCIVRAALDGELDDSEYRVDETFGFEVPLAVPGVSSALLDPRATWADSGAYDRQVERLASMFQENFDAFEADQVIRSAGPRTQTPTADG